MDLTTLRLGTRASPLALAQANAVADALLATAEGNLTVDVQTFSTKGDQLTTERLINSGGKGLFTRELDDALLAGRIDLAVHSLKDVPTDLPQEIQCVAFPRRADPREAFICRAVAHPLDLPEGAVVGTASLRREAQTLALRPDLKIVPFRGSVGTRLEKLDRGEATATWLAMAGLTRLGLTDVAHPIPVEDMLPSAGQGILGIAIRPGLPDALRDLIMTLNHNESAKAAAAERALLDDLDGSCRTAIAAHARLDRDFWHIKAEVLSPDGGQRWAAERRLAANALETQLAEAGRDLGREIRDVAGGTLPHFEGA